jgi:uncharacterized protein (TIGR03437 family)
LFSANADGQGAPAAQAVLAAPNGSQTALPVYQCGSTAGSCTPAPLNTGTAGTHLVLALYGTGIRGRSALGSVICYIGGVGVPVDYAGPQPQYEGLDQVNVTVPASLAGSGQTSLYLVVDGQTSNTVTIDIR